MFAFQDTQGPVEIAFTDRHGGTSGGPFASLNLAEPPRGDAGGRARARRGPPQRRARRPGVRRRRPRPRRPRPSYACGRCTAADVARRRRRPTPTAPPTGDGLVTAEPGMVLMVRVADCVPVLLADPAAGVVAAVHAGRPGLAAGVVPAGRRGDARRSAPAGSRAWVGPHVCGACYEVPEQLRAEVSAVVPEAYAETSWGTPVARHRRRGARPARRRRRRGRRRVALHDRGRGPVLLPPPGRRLRAGWPAWSGCGRDATRRGATSSPRNLERGPRPDRRRLRARPAARPTR